MKIECVKDKLKNALLSTERGTGKNLNLPVLGAILFEAKDTELILRSTNLDIGIEIRIPAKINEEGKAAVPAGTLSSFLSNTTGEERIQIESVNDNIKLESPYNKATVKCVSYEDFPTLPSVETENTFTIQSKELLEGIRSVQYSASSSDVKPELASIYIYPDDGKLVFVATDSFRLAEKKISVKNISDFPGILIPQKNAVEIARLFEAYPDEITASYNNNQISFSHKQAKILSRLVDGDFPDYRQLLPKETLTQATVLKQDLMNALKTGVVFSDKFNKTLLSLNPSKNTFFIETKNANIGESTISVDATLEGEEVEVLCNHRYITDVFQSIHQDSIHLSFNGAHKAIIIKGVGDPSFLYLVSPMNK